MVSNRTTDGGLACVFGTPWLDHFPAHPRKRTGCAACDQTTFGTHSDQSPHSVSHPRTAPSKGDRENEN